MIFPATGMRLRMEFTVWQPLSANCATLMTLSVGAAVLMLKNS
jgi:hypothetical protein